MVFHRRQSSLHAGGFTLAEVLAALAVLAFGLSAVIGLYIGTLKHGHIPSDRNAVMILLPEAVRSIRSLHLITEEFMQDQTPPDQWPKYEIDIGTYIETLAVRMPMLPTGSPTTNHFNLGPDNKYSSFIMRTSSGTEEQIRQWGALGATSLNSWPSVPQAAADVGGSRYRFLYRLEKHPDWQPHKLDGSDPALDAGEDDVAPENNYSLYRGIYLLTLICYRTPTDKLQDWVQVSEPMAMLLRDRKDRP